MRAASALVSAAAVSLPFSLGTPNGAASYALGNSGSALDKGKGQDPADLTSSDVKSNRAAANADLASTTANGNQKLFSKLSHFIRTSQDKNTGASAQQQQPPPSSSPAFAKKVSLPYHYQAQTMLEGQARKIQARSHRRLTALQQRRMQAAGVLHQLDEYAPPQDLLHRSRLSSQSSSTSGTGKSSRDWSRDGSSRGSSASMSRVSSTMPLTQRPLQRAASLMKDGSGNDAAGGSKRSLIDQIP